MSKLAECLLPEGDARDTLRRDVQTPVANLQYLKVSKMKFLPGFGFGFMSAIIHFKHLTYLTK